MLALFIFFRRNRAACSALKLREYRTLVKQQQQLEHQQQQQHAAVEMFVPVALPTLYAEPRLV